MEDYTLDKKTIETLSKAILSNLDDERKELPLAKKLKDAIDETYITHEELTSVLKKYFPGIIDLAKSSDQILRIRHLKLGEPISYTSCSITNNTMELQVITEPKLTAIGWQCEVSNGDGEEFTLFENSSYIPKIERNYNKQQLDLKSTIQQKLFRQKK